jgi:hypothetical protein
MINSLSLPGYQLVDSDEQNEDIHFRLEAPTPVACEGCGVQGEFVRFGKRDVPYRDLPIRGGPGKLYSVLSDILAQPCRR